MWSDFEKLYGLQLPNSTMDDGISIFEEPLIVTCNSCSMSILAPSFHSHFSECTGNIISQDPIKPPPAKKKIPGLKKKEKKKLDLDRHCGVLLENGEYCIRSLKCKNHTLNMKRQVSGRSNSFDILYNDSSKVSKSTIQVTIANSLSPDQEVSCILKSLESFTPNPLVIYHDPCILNLARLKNDLVLSEIVRLPT